MARALTADVRVVLTYARNRLNYGIWSPSVTTVRGHHFSMSNPTILTVSAATCAICSQPQHPCKTCGHRFCGCEHTHGVDSPTRDC